MILHPAIGSNRYCGPAALAILTGLSTDETAKVLRDVSGRRAIRRIPNRYMLRALDRLGLEHLGWVGVHRKPLHKFVAHSSAQGVYLIVITGHYVVLDTVTNEVCDNMTIYPLPLAKYRQKGKHVRQAWRIL